MKMRMMQCLSMVAIVVGVLWGGHAFAQTRSVSEVTIEIDGWTLTPILEESGGSTAVHSFLCLLDIDLLQRNNLATVWFVRGQDANGAPKWEASSWLTQDQWESIEFVKSELWIADVYDHRWPTKCPKPTVKPTSPEAAKQYKGGVLEEDPIAPIIEQSSNPGLIIQGLVAVGYPAAGIDIETPFQDCPFDLVLEAYSLGLEAIIGSNVTSIESGIAAFDSTLALFGCSRPGCQVETWTGAKTEWSEWSSPTAYHCSQHTDSFGFTVDCECCRQRTRQRTQWRVHRYQNCTLATCQQSQVETQTECHTCALNALGSCPPTAACVPNVNAPFSSNDGNAGPWVPSCTTW